jgi:hypothetical protein
MSHIAEWNPFVFGGVAPVSVTSTKTIAKLFVPVGAPVHASGGICEAAKVDSHVASVGNGAPSAN